MKDIPLRKYMEGRSQKMVAEKMGVTPGAVHQMIRDKRNIFIRISSSGAVIAAYEVRPIGSIRSVNRPSETGITAA